MSRRAILYFSVAGVALHAWGCGGEVGGEEPLASVDLNLPLDGMCEIKLRNDEGLPRGLYDISAGSGFCERDYTTRLRINNLHRAAPVDPPWRESETHGILRVLSVDVTLKAEDGEPIVFQATDSPLANPFRQTADVAVAPRRAADSSFASITVQTIPGTYAEFLTDRVGETLRADIELLGVHYEDGQVEPVDADFEEFSYPIEICDGCLTVCASESTEPVAPTGVCDDGAGQDGRVCHDTGC